MYHTVSKMMYIREWVQWISINSILGGRYFEATDASSNYWEATSYGQVKLAVTHHNMSSDEPLQLECDKPLAFLMDPPKSPDQGEGGKPPKKKPRKSSTRTLTSKSFGSILDVGKLKKAKRLVIGWRVRWPAWNPKQTVFLLYRLVLPFDNCASWTSLIVLMDWPAYHLGRLDTNNSAGLKTIVPIRPIAVLSGTLDLDQVVVKLFWPGPSSGGTDSIGFWEGSHS